MAEMLIQSESLTPIADQIRVLSGTTEPMGLDAMENHVGEANTNVATEASLIAQITTALEGKANDSGSDSKEDVKIASGIVNLNTNSSKRFCSISGLGFTPKNIIMHVYNRQDMTVYFFDKIVVSITTGENFDSSVTTITKGSPLNAIDNKTSMCTCDIQEDGFSITINDSNYTFAGTEYVYCAFG